MTQEYNRSSDQVNNSGSLTGKYCFYNFGCMNYGQRLLAARNHAGLTQKQLSDKINNACSQENISKLERGNATGSEFTAQFADACGVRAMWLAEEHGDMVDGIYVEDVRIKHIAMVCESLPDYAVDQLVQQSYALAELIKKTRAAS